VLKEFICDGSSGVIINDLITHNLLPVLEEYDKRGIKYAFLNYDIAEAPRCFAMVNDYNGAAGLAAELLSLCTKPERTLAVISHSVPSETQKKLAEGFNKKTLELGKTKIVNVSSIDDLLDNNSIGGIYVSHASYLEICQKIEKVWDKDNRPKTVVSDLYEEGVPYIENGVITAVIFQDPEKQAFVTANSLYELLSEGKRCDSLLTVDPIIVMKSNYKKYL
jgi:LacI family transcriptional regulator